MREYGSDGEARSIPGAGNDGKRETAKHTFGCGYVRALLLVLVMLALVCGGAIAETPLYIVANASNDGYMRNSTDGPWSQIRDGIGDAVANGNTVQDYAGYVKSTTTTDVFDYQYRAGITFSGADIPTYAIIDKINISVRGDTKVADLGTVNLSIIDFNPVSKTSYAATDYSRTNFTRQAADIPYNTYLTGNVFNNFSLNYIAISNFTKSGAPNTYIITNSADVDNTPLTWASDKFSGYVFLPAGYTSGNFFPKEYITYHWPNYMFIGDSITRGALTGSDLAENGSSVYSNYMVTTYDPTNSSMNNADGGGRNSTWGLQNLDAHYNTSNKVFGVMFGANDRSYDIGYLNGTQTVWNYISMYNYLAANGTEPWLIINTLQQNDGNAWNLLTSQRDNITTIRLGLNDANIPHIDGYDAVDSIPGNGVADDWNTSYYADNIHLNLSGHKELGSFIWNSVHTTPTSRFTPNVTAGAKLQAVVFNESCSGYILSRNWTFTNVTGNNTPVIFSINNLANPVHVFGPGNYSISLNSTNSAGFNISSQVTWVNVSPDAPLSSFTLSSPLVLIPQPVTVNSTSTNSPTTYNWSWGDDQWTNTTHAVDGPGASHSYTAIGNYSIYLVASNEYGSNTSGIQYLDVIPPYAIHNLTNITPADNEITWSWEWETPDPVDEILMIYRNNTWWTNSSNTTTSRIWNGLPPGTPMAFGSLTCYADGGECNQTWVNKTVNTSGTCPTPTPTPTPTPVPTITSPDIPHWNAAKADPVSFFATAWGLISILVSVVIASACFFVLTAIGSSKGISFETLMDLAASIALGIVILVVCYYVMTTTGGAIAAL